MALVAVDVGGTNVRFAVAGASGLGDIRSMLCANYPSLAAAFAAYLAGTGVTAKAASIAVAGPVQAAEVDVTNNHWQFSKAGLLAEAGLENEIQQDETCCYATQNKVITHDPDGTMWEWYRVLEYSPTFFAEPAPEVGCCAAAEEAR